MYSPKKEKNMSKKDEESSVSKWREHIKSSFNPVSRLQKNIFLSYSNSLYIFTTNKKKKSRK